MFLLMLIQSDSFTRFTYCVQRPGQFESQCIELDPTGKGQGRFKRRAGDEIKMDIALSPTARERYLTLLAATNYLDQADTYESQRRVANLGRKHLKLELPSGAPREGVFNFSTRKDVMDLVTLFDAVINQEMWALEIETALRFDRLGIPKKIERIESDLKNNRIADPERLVPILDKILADQRIMNYARDHAGKMKEQILTKKLGKSNR